MLSKRTWGFVDVEIASGADVIGHGLNDKEYTSSATMKKKMVDEEGIYNNNIK